MNTMETICSRKSIRSYTGEQIPEEQLKKILKAANAAPIGMGQYDAMHLTVVRNPALLRKIEQAGAAKFGKPDMHPLYGAPLLVVVSTKAPGKGMENVAFSNAAIVVQNMALEATELGVGVCHIWGAIAALSAAPDVVRGLDLPEGFIPCCAVTLGKTDDQYEVREVPEGRIAVNTVE